MGGKYNGGGYKGKGTVGDVPGGATAGATGENAIIYNCKDADIIIGPIGILLANSMYGEISPAMAAAVSASTAKIILIPVSKCPIQVVGTTDKPLSRYLEDAAVQVSQLCKKGEKI